MLIWLNKLIERQKRKKTALCWLFLVFFLAKPCLAYPPPVISVQPTNETVLLNGTAVFSVTAPYNGSTLYYQWLKNGSNILWATLTSLTITNAQLTDQGVYSVIVNNAGGSVTSSNATLTLAVPPGIITQPQSQGVPKGSNVTFSVIASGTSPFTYWWYLGTSKLGGGSTSSNLTLVNVDSSKAGNYTVVVKNNYGSITSAVAALTVYVLPGIQTQPKNQTVLQGTNVSFSVVTNNSGTPPFSYQWNVNGTNTSDGPGFSGSTNATLTISNVQPAQAGNVFVVITNNAGSITSQVAHLTVNVPAFITTQPQSQTVLQGQSAAFTVGAGGTANLSYQWYFNGAKVGGPKGQNATLSIKSVDQNSVGNYTVVVNNNWGSVTSAVATLTIAVPPTITMQPQSQALIQGQTAAFTVTADGTAPFGYQWSVNGTNLFGATNTLLTLTNIQTTDAANYSVVVTNIAGSVTSAVAALTVYVLPGIQTQPQNQTVLQGQTATFFVVTNNNGTPPFYYQWNVNGTNTTDDGQFVFGSTNATLTLNNVQPAQAGNVFVVITNLAGSITSSVVTLTVNVPAFITNQPVSQALVQGQSTTFSVGAGGTANLSYQWYFNGAQMGGGSSSSALSLNSLTTNNAGSYTVVVNNNYGTVTSAVATLTVYVPPAITSQPTNQALVLGQSATFSVTALGAPTLAYQWNVNGTNIDGATNDLLTLNNIQMTDAASYAVVVTNIAGSATSSVATLTVYLPTIITTQPQSIGVAQGQNVSLSVAASGTAPWTYQWYFVGSNGQTNSIAGGTSSTYAINNVGSDKAGSYWVVVTGAGGSVTSTVAVVTVYVLPGIQTQPQNQTVLQGQTATFSVVTDDNGTPPFYYQWNVNGTNTTDDGQFVFGSTNATLTLSNVQPAQAGNVFVVITNMAGSITSSVVTLTVNVPAGIVTQPLNQTVTQGSNVVFSVVPSGTAPFGYQWTFNCTNLVGATNATLTLNNVDTNNAGTYAVVVTNVAGTITSSNAVLTVNVPVGIATQPVSQTVTQGSNVVFSVVASGTAPFGYQWTFNSTNLVGATNATLTLNNVDTNNVGSYAVMVTNVAGTITSSNATLTVNVPPNITIPPLSQTVTAGQNATFNVVVTGTGPLFYQWSFYGTNLAGATNAWLTVTNVQMAQAGSYTIQVTNSAGSVASSANLIVTTSVITLTTINGTSPTTSGGYAFQITLPAGSTYVVLACSDLQNWIPIATNVAATGSIVFTDVFATNYNARFYRALLPQ